MKLDSLTRPVALVATLFTAFSAITLTSDFAFAFPLTSRNWTLKEPSEHRFASPGFNFNGIVALLNCSGSLVRFKSSQDTDLAMVLTNGHCITTGRSKGFIEPGEVIVDQPAGLQIDILAKDGSTLETLATSRILYATMTDTDVTLLEMKITYADIEKQTGSTPLTLADSASEIGANIQIPSGYWKRTYACQTEALIPFLKEADWTFKNSIRYSQPGCETVGGTSGSPLVSVQSGEVIGINNTGNEDGESCTINNPCEIDEHGHQTIREGRSYGQQTFLFYGCLSQGANRLANRIDLARSGCALPKPSPQN